MAGYTARFRSMDEGTAEEYAELIGLYRKFSRSQADNVLAALERLRGLRYGFPVDRLEHSLQTASRAFRDEADEETVVVALLHDIGDILAPHNHPEIAAAVLRPFVSEENHWLVAHHDVFQGYYFFDKLGLDRNAREKYRGHPAFEKTAHFAERWDQRAFDPDYDTMPLEDFEPMVRRIFAREPFRGTESRSDDALRSDLTGGEKTPSSARV